jgi:hypothetical protein
VGISETACSMVHRQLSLLPVDEYVKKEIFMHMALPLPHIHLWNVKMSTFSVHFQMGGIFLSLLTLLHDGLNFIIPSMLQLFLLLGAFSSTLVGLVLHTNFALIMVLTLLQTLSLSFYLLLVYNSVSLWLIPKRRIHLLNA